MGILQQHHNTNHGKGDEGNEGHESKEGDEGDEDENSRKGVASVEGNTFENSRWSRKVRLDEEQARQGGVPQEITAKQAKPMDEGLCCSAQGFGHHWFRGHWRENSSRQGFVCEGKVIVHRLRSDREATKSINGHF